MVGVHESCVRFAPGLLAQVPLRGPGEGVFGDARGFGHPGVAEVASVGQHRGVEVADQVGVARLGAAGVGERLAEPGVAVDLDEQRGQVDLGQPRGDRRRECLGFGGDVFGGHGRDDQIVVLADAGEALTGRIGEHSLQIGDRRVQLGLHSLQLPLRIGVGTGDGAEVVALGHPRLDGDEQCGRVRVAK
jgi:hypothetical protein